MATRVAVMSDSHGLLRPEVVAAVRGCDAVIHAGDLDEPRVLETLQGLAPVYVVRGNNDWTLPEGVPQRLAFRIEDCHFMMAHDKRDIPKALDGVDVVIFGHSHIYHEEIVDGRLWLNPGSCGYRRFHSDLCYVIMTVEGHEVTIEKHYLED